MEFFGYLSPGKKKMSIFQEKINEGVLSLMQINKRKKKSVISFLDSIPHKILELLHLSLDIDNNYLSKKHLVLERFFRMKNLFRN